MMHYCLDYVFTFLMSSYSGPENNYQVKGSLKEKKCYFAMQYNVEFFQLHSERLSFLSLFPLHFYFSQCVIYYVATVNSSMYNHLKLKKILKI